ncbi:hypothetical protein JCM10295v2_006247 [Rhodotorula toruloides]
MAPLTLEDFAQADLRDVLARLTVKERISLLAGPDWWTTTPIPRVGVPSIKVSDGPNGVRGSSHFRPTPAQTLPSATALGATFDVEAVEKMGKVLAHEAKAKGSSLLLAPTVNIQRNPLNGPAYIDGLQKNGVGATIKHYVGNDQEHERLSVDVQIPERALREIYLKPFEIAQRVAKPWSFMTSYSRVNGTHVSESKELLQDILRTEWKFDGLIMSDWPGPTRWRGELVTHLLAAGKIEIEAHNARAHAVLQAVQRSCRADLENVRTNRRPEVPHDSQADRDTCRAVSSDTIRNVLPLKKSIKKLAVIGPNTKTRTVSGGGSAYLTASYVVTPYEGIKEAAETNGIEVQYEPGCYAHRYLPMLDGLIRTKADDSGWTATFYNEAANSSFAPAVVDLLGTRIRINDQKPEGLADLFFLELEGYITPDESGPYDFGISLVGRAQVSVDDKLVVDNGWTTKQTPGPSFYGLGTIEEIGTVDVEAGKTYKIVVRYTNHPREVVEEQEAQQEDDEAGQKQPALMMAALRLGGAPRIQEDESIERAVKLSSESDAVVVVIGTNMDWEAEAADCASLALPGRTDELVSRILSANPNAVIVNQSGSAVAFPWIDKAATVVQAWFGGNCAGQAIADVLFEGSVNPSGRMSLSFPYRIEDCTAHLNWGSEGGKVLYGEGIFWSQLSASLASSRPSSAADLSVSISLNVRNTGTIAGRDVVQIYILPPSTSTYRRPARELKGFVKTRLLAPHEEETVKLELPKEAFAYWRDSKDSKNGWVAEKGEYTVAAQRSSRKEDVVEVARVRLESTMYWRRL